MWRLIKIQQALKAPKNQYNKFGDYHFRSAEDILEAVKPLLKEAKLALIMVDDLILIGDRYYVKSTAKLFDETGKLIAEAHAHAREAESITKQVAAQITGGASSYARKYALNGLFSIDDTKDIDGAKQKRPNKEIKVEGTGKEIKTTGNEKESFISLEQKNKLKEILGGVEFANLMNNNNGRLSIEKYNGIIEEKRKAVINTR